MNTPNTSTQPTSAPVLNRSTSIKSQPQVQPMVQPTEVITTVIISGKTQEELALACPLTFSDIQALLPSTATLYEGLQSLASLQYIYADAMVKEHKARESLKGNS